MAPPEVIQCLGWRNWALPGAPPSTRAAHAASAPPLCLRGSGGGAGDGRRGSRGMPSASGSIAGGATASRMALRGWIHTSTPTSSHGRRRPTRDARNSARRHGCVVRGMSIVSANAWDALCHSRTMQRRGDGRLPQASRWTNEIRWRSAIWLSGHARCSPELARARQTSRPLSCTHRAWAADIR
jgi:hypothetical protein